MAPTPPFVGAPLDPPLRSRFSARAIDAMPLTAQVQVAQRALPAVVALPAWRSVLALERFCALQQDATSGGALVRVPPFPSTAVWFAARSLSQLPHQSARHLVARLWPLDQLACADAPHLWQALSPNLGSEDDTQFGYRIVGASRRQATRTITLQFARASDGAITTVDVVGGRHGTPSVHAPAGVVAIDALVDCLSAMLADAAVGGGGDLCVLSAEGCGKSVMCAWFAQALGYGADEVVHIDLFKEVSTRDLFMRRDTSDSGDTVWQMQPLVQAVLHGRLALLDGAHRPPPGVLAALTELLLDRQLALDDGTRILCAQAYDAMQFREALTDEQMLARGWRRAHEAFRVVLCGNTASSHAEERAAAHSWLTADLIAGLRCHVLPELTATLLRLVVRGACGAALPEVVVEDLACVVELQRRLVRPAPLVPPAMGVEEERRLSHAPQSAPPQFTAASLPLLSLRAALRVARKAAMFGVHSVFDAVGSSAAVRLQVLESALRLAYAPPHAAETIRHALEAHIAATPWQAAQSIARAEPLQLEVGADSIRLGDVAVPIERGVVDEARIPRTLFVEVQSQLAILREMMKDFVLGEHIMLIGPQGSGKNKLSDQFVRLMNRECNYIQLHRDTTLQSLTVSPSLEAGRLRIVDSPVIDAVVHGRILIVDEADKAPREVVAALRALAADGALTLGDGRRVCRRRAGDSAAMARDIVPLHPAFRIFFLANRVGFPFLGENVLAELGDVCALHSVDNPDIESEIVMLRSYAPHVPVEVLRLLCELWADLRTLVANGELSYPYSLREIVAVARHLEAFGSSQGLAPALRNVFDFDAHNAALRRTLAQAMMRHGLSLDDIGGDDKPPPVVALAGSAAVASDIAAIRVATDAWVPVGGVERADAAVRGVWTPEVDLLPPPAPENLRDGRFDEQRWRWRPREGDGGGRLVAMCFDETGQLHALAARPLRLYAVPTLKNRGRALSLQQHVPWYTGDWSAASSDKASFAMMALGDGRVAMLIGWFGLLLIADRAGVVTVFNAPPAPPVGTPSIGIAGPMSFIAIARNNSQQFANVQDAALVAAKSPQQLVARPVSVLGVAARHALLWRAGATTVALVQFVREPPLPSWLADVGFAVRSVHWLGNGDPLATVDSALLIGEDGALAVLRVPLAPDAPPFAVLRIIAPLQSLGSLLGAARCTHDGAIVLAFERTFATRMSACWPAENAAFGLSVWVRDDAPVFGAKATAFLHRSNQIVNLAEDGESVRLELTDVVEDRVRVVSCATGRTKPVGNNEHMVAVIAESPVDGEFAVLCESTDNAVIVLQADTDATQRALATWRYVRGAVAQPPSPSQTQTQSADARGSGQGNGEGDSKDAQGQGVGDGQGEGQGDGSGTGAPSEGGGDGERKRAAAELTEEARLFAVRALRDKLAAIDMAEFDARAYEARLSRVATAVTQLRSIFEAAQAASRERQWQTRKTSGELDEHRLVDGLTGERNVYRVRAERDPGLFQPLPKVLIFVVDASASMERFNGYDKRLDRTLDCLVMIMEALDGWEQKYAYEIVGHSGDQPAVELGAPLGRPPRSRADRWRLLRRVATHAANCPSGDASVEALRRAVRRAASVEADERLVLLLSDANLSRHGIEASDLAEAMALPTTRAVATSSARETMAVARAANVRCRCLFVAQWNDAQRVQAALPRGTVHLVERPDDLPVAIAASMAHEMTAKL